MKKPDAQKNGLRILIVRISAIGDVLHVTSVVHNLRRLLPDAEITWLASPPASLLLETNPDIDRLLVWDRRPLDEASAHFDLLDCWRELKKARALLKPYTFDIALDLQGLFLTGILTRLSGAKRRIGIHERHEGNPFFMTEMAPDIPDPHKIRRYYTALAPLGFGPETFEPGPVLVLPESLSGFATKFWAAHGIDTARPILMVCVRTTWPDKNWPPAYFGEALAAVPEDVQIVFSGAKGDAPYIEEAQKSLAKHAPGRRTLSIAGETSLLELAALLQTAALLFTGDTGPLYIAEAVGTKTLSLWGPTMPEIYGPLTEGHVFLRSPYECVACCKTRCDRKNNGCMNALKPKIAAEMLRKFFATTTSSPGGTGTFLRNPFE